MHSDADAIVRNGHLRHRYRSNHVRAQTDVGEARAPIQAASRASASDTAARRALPTWARPVGCTGWLHTSVVHEDLRHRYCRGTNATRSVCAHVSTFSDHGRRR